MSITKFVFPLLFQMSITKFVFPLLSQMSIVNLAGRFHFVSYLNPLILCVRIYECLIISCIILEYVGQCCVLYVHRCLTPNHLFNHFVSTWTVVKSETVMTVNTTHVNH